MIQSARSGRDIAQALDDRFARGAGDLAERAQAARVAIVRASYPVERQRGDVGDCAHGGVGDRHHRDIVDGIPLGAVVGFHGAECSPRSGERDVSLFWRTPAGDAMRQ